MTHCWEQLLNLKGVTANTVSNWIKDVGIDTTRFKAHSTRSAATSKAFRNGTPIDDVLMMAEWSHARTFFRFYCRSANESSGFSKTVLDIGQCMSFEPAMLYLMMFSEI